MLRHYSGKSRALNKWSYLNMATPTNEFRSGRYPGERAYMEGYSQKQILMCPGYVLEADALAKCRSFIFMKRFSKYS
jgi:hypothetical protein